MSTRTSPIGLMGVGRGRARDGRALITSEYIRHVSQRAPVGVGKGGGGLGLYFAAAPSGVHGPVEHQEHSEVARLLASWRRYRGRVRLAGPSPSWSSALRWVLVNTTGRESAWNCSTRNAVSYGVAPVGDHDAVDVLIRQGVHYRLADDIHVGEGEGEAVDRQRRADVEVDSGGDGHAGDEDRYRPPTPPWRRSRGATGDRASRCAQRRPAA